MDFCIANQFCDNAGELAYSEESIEIIFTNRASRCLDKLRPSPGKRASDSTLSQFVCKCKERDTDRGEACVETK